MKDTSERGPATRKFALRLLHAIAVVALLSSATLVLATVVGATGVHAVANGTITPERFQSVISLATKIRPVSQILFCAVCALLIWRRLRYAILLPALALCWGTIIYFGYDLPQRPSLPDVGPVATPDAEGYRIFCWMVKDSPFSRLSELREPQLGSNPFISQPPEKCRAWLSANRERVLRNWEEDTMGREWIAALAKAPNCGVIVPDPDGPILGFQACRAILDHQLAYAAWLATENRGDEAVQVLGPLLRAGNALQRSAAGPIPSTIARVFLQVGYKNANLVLDCGAPGSAARSDLISILRETPPIATTVRNCVVGEFAATRTSLERGRLAGSAELAAGMQSGGLLSLAARFGNPIVNPNLTEQTLKGFMERCANLAQQRQMEPLREFIGRFQRGQSAWYQIKNSAGSAALGTIIDPSVVKAYDGLWANEDTRLALLKRLESKPATAVSP